MGPRGSIPEVGTPGTLGRVLIEKAQLLGETIWRFLPILEFPCGRQFPEKWDTCPHANLHTTVLSQKLYSHESGSGSKPSVLQWVNAHGQLWCIVRDITRP